jgi:class 3 adenylate cyclase
MAHRATDTLLAAADEAVRANLRADEELEAALERHGGQQQQALRDAFLADFRRLSEQNNGAVSYDDLVEGTHLYDQRLGELLASRDSLRQLFEAKRRAQAAALDLILKARDLTAGEIQQYESLDEILRQIGQAAGQAFPQGGGSSPAPSSGAGEAK